MSKKLELIRASKSFLVVDSLDNPSSIQRHELARETGDTLVSTKGKDFQFLKDFCWPVEAEDELRSILTERARLKKAFDDSMSLVYQLSNKIARGEVK